MEILARLFTGGMMGLAAILLSACSTEPASNVGESGATPHGPVVLAASSMQEVMEEIAADWEQQGHAPVQLSFASSAALARQIESGAPADLFVSADQLWMDYLQDRDALAPEGAVIIATNSLVLIGPNTDGKRPATQKNASSEGDLAKIRQSLAALGDGRLAIGDPASVPAGRYGKAALSDLGLWNAVEAKTIPAENVRAALAFVARGEASLGIVYASDAAVSTAVKTIGQFPDTSHPPIVYPAAVLAASRNSEAKAFLAFLSSGDARSVMVRHGFGLFAP